MKYSYNWLREISGTKLTAQEVIEGITMHALEIEGVEKVGTDFENFVVGEILEIAKHPNADKLQLTKVNIGPSLPASLSKGERGNGQDIILDIVCGAKNISVGDKVPVALVGARMINGLEIKEAEIRGEKSFGMLCAQDELGLGNDHAGILLLDKEVKIGTPLQEILGEQDQIFEIKVLPDRAHDAVSHVGLAREVAALENAKIAYDYDGLKLPKKKTSALKIKIEDSGLCSRYIAAKLDGLKIEKSPQWLSARLEKCGIRSINNVVDVTNYVMLELGQPMHAFDFAQISQQEVAEITVRMAQQDEEITLLDESVKKMSPEDILITNKDGVLALAGVMGGKNSGINQETTSIVLEAASFEATAIRKTRNKFALQTDAALRFEKGLDPNLAEKAMVRALEILTHITDAKLDGIVDEYPAPVKPWTVKLELTYVSSLLGEKVPVSVSQKILTSLGFEVKKSGENLTVTVPTFRLDVRTQEDLIEEIGRVYGFEKIAASAQLVLVKPPTPNKEKIFVRKAKNILAGLGFSEVYNYAFYGQKDCQAARLQSIKHLELALPMSPEQAILRVSLLPNMLKNVRENLKHTKQLQLFEIGKVFLPSEVLLPNEKNVLCGLVVLEKKASKKGTASNLQETCFFQAKALAENLLAQLGVSEFEFAPMSQQSKQIAQSFVHQGRASQIKITGTNEIVGTLAEVDPLVLVAFDIQTRVAFFEFELSALQALATTTRQFKTLPKYPIVTRDLALVVATEKVSVAEILATMKKEAGELLLEIEMFDIFEMAQGNFSYAFHLSFNAPERTLTNPEIESVMEKIITSLEKELGAQIRK
ncbi:MAG: phenylalanine--tRNA ligase subunit beta [Candidatus Moraniibacteriota bacterium]